MEPKGCLNLKNNPFSPPKSPKTAKKSVFLQKKFDHSPENAEQYAC